MNWCRSEGCCSEESMNGDDDSIEFEGGHADDAKGHADKQQNQNSSAAAPATLTVKKRN